MSEPQHTAGAFDIRNVIGGLMAIYGVIMLLMGLFGARELNKTGGINANLWAGIALLTVGAIFAGWARARPVVIPDATSPPEGDRPPRRH